MNTLKLIKEYASLQFENPLTQLNPSVNADVNGYYEAYESGELTAEDISALEQQVKALRNLIKSYNQLNFTFA